MKKVLSQLFLILFAQALYAEFPQRNFYFMRHAETQQNHDRVAQGNLDTSLNSTGVKQAKKIARALKNKGITCVITSKLERARVTGEIIARKLGVPLVTFDNLRGRSKGIMNGKPFGEWVQEWKVDKLIIPGAEKSQEFHDRIIGCIQDILMRFPGPILIISHGDTGPALSKETHTHYTKTAINAFPLFFEAPKHDNDTWKVYQVA